MQNVLKTTKTTYEGDKRDEMAHIKFIGSVVTAESPDLSGSFFLLNINSR